MKIQTECVPCLLKRVIFESEHCTNDKNKKTKAIKNACKILSEMYDPNTCSASIATKVHKSVYESLNNKDPYEKLKKQANEAALRLVPRAEELIKNSDDKLMMSILVSIVGNMMDFGIAGASSDPDDLVNIFEKTIEEGFGHNDYKEVKKLILRSKKIVFFTDNCGEIVFDKLLCREIKKLNSDLELTLVVKGEPVLSDATMKDAVYLGFDEVVDYILTTDCFAVGLDFNKMSKKLKKSLAEADLIICKGMANYEAFSETDYRPITYFMRVKCSAIANSMNVSQNSNIVKIYK